MATEMLLPIPLQSPTMKKKSCMMTTTVATVHTHTHNYIDIELQKVGLFNRVYFYVTFMVVVDDHQVKQRSRKKIISQA